MPTSCHQAGRLPDRSSQGSAGRLTATAHVFDFFLSSQVVNELSTLSTRPPAQGAPSAGNGWARRLRPGRADPVTADEACASLSEPGRWRPPHSQPALIGGQAGLESAGGAAGEGGGGGGGKGGGGGVTVIAHG